MLGWEAARHEMVRRQIEARGIRSEDLLEAMRQVPRHCFVEKAWQSEAYSDAPLPIGEEQTISQPYIVALMISGASVAKGDRVLEIGTGSGYSAAILHAMGCQVYTIERLPSLLERARQVWQDLDYKGIHSKLDDGTLGLPEEAPFDAIIVTAAGPHIPNALIKQLRVGGRLIIPVGGRADQKLIRGLKLDEATLDEELMEYVRFVPLIGRDGWDDV